MENERIIFFGSGDFPRYTFEFLTDGNKKYEVVGVVTSFENSCEDGGHPLSTCALAKKIPYRKVHTAKDDGLIDWCKELKPTMFVVISFKKMPKKLLDVVDNRAFNIHASMLPFLKGANPIRWAIRNGFKETGLTAIELSDKIDCGKILYNIKVPIKKDDNYGTLKQRLSYLCQVITDKVIRNYDKLYGIEQSECGRYSQLLYAPKFDEDYHKVEFNSPLDVLQSMLPNNGLRCIIYVHERIPSSDFKIGYTYRRKENLKCTVWGLHYAEEGDDNRAYLWSPLGGKTDYIIDEIQLDGKKRMKFSDFINGFKYAKPIPEDKGLKLKKYQFGIHHQ